MIKYKINKFNSNIENLLRISMFTYNEALYNIDFIDTQDEELQTNLFHPSLWKLEVKLMQEEISRNVNSKAENIIKAFQYAFKEGSLDNLEEVEMFKVNFYRYLGFLEIN